MQLFLKIYIILVIRFSFNPPMETPINLFSIFIVLEPQSRQKQKLNFELLYKYANINENG